MAIDRITIPADIPDFHYALIDKGKLQQLRNKLKEAGKFLFNF